MATYAVAPYAGAWIETPATMTTMPTPRPSPPTRGRGLKLSGLLDYYMETAVAPYAGAWIETLVRFI